MNERNELVRTLSAEESAALAPLPDSDEESPTTARSEQRTESTAEAHLPGVLGEFGDAEGYSDGPPNPISVEEY
jgi:hypothetical protein